jgi:hypothetical protein
VLVRKNSKRLKQIESVLKLAVVIFGIEEALPGWRAVIDLETSS